MVYKVNDNHGSKEPNSNDNLSVSYDLYII